jgi:hypothetical protein
LILNYKEITIDFDRLNTAGEHVAYEIIVEFPSDYLIGATDLYFDIYNDLYDGDVNIVDDYENLYTANYA